MHEIVRKSAESRFWQKVSFGDGCWEWQASLSTHGYGQFNIGVKLYGAHRVAYALKNGPIPDGAQILHRCDNPACVRPSHLFPGDHRSNMRDMAAKGRSTRGERNPSAKLSLDQVREIRERLEFSRRGAQKLLASEFGVAPRTISAIAARKLWKDTPHG